MINNGSVSTADPAIRDGLKWNELEMAAIQHTDNTKFIDRLRNQQPSNVIYQVLVGILELGTDKRKC